MFIVHTKQSYGASGSIENKVKLQKLLFPSGIVIEPVKRQYRTSKVNSVFSLISSIAKDNRRETKNASTEKDDASWLVAGAGLEPATFGL